MRLHLRYGRNPLVRVALGLVFFAVVTRGAARRPVANAVHSSGPVPASPAAAPSSTDLLFTPASLPAAVSPDGNPGATPDGNPGALSSIAPLASTSPSEQEDESEPTACPAGMALVEGDYCPALGQTCLHELGGPVERCQEFAKNAACAGHTQHKRFCIDRYEYPNQPGVKPVVMVTWEQAKATCEQEGKRLCTDSEWTLACEGEERRPYPYGYERDANACNIDRELPVPDQAALADPRRAADEAARLDQRVPSGTMNRCTSPYGVHDMTGNVDEWVVNERHYSVAADDPSRPFASGLKGGYWGPVRNRCRPMTTAHNETFRYYQIGFRCCSGTSE